MGLFRRTYELPARGFPTEGYFFPIGEDEELEYLKYSEQLHEESRSLGVKGRANRATLADIRVTEGPTDEDRSALPYIQEAWEWGVKACVSLGMKPGHLRYGVILDYLTRMRAAVLIWRREEISAEAAYRLVGLDVNRILFEHNGRAGDVMPQLDRLGDAVEAD